LFTPGVSCGNSPPWEYVSDCIIMRFPRLALDSIVSPEVNPDKMSRGGLLGELLLIE
jgi:hypothetical protein